MNFYFAHSRICRIEKKKYIMRKNIHMMLMTAFFILLSATSIFAQKITLNKKNASLQELFKDIGKQSGFDFIYNAQLIKTGKRIDIKVHEASLLDVLNFCFLEQPFEYEIQDKSIYVKAKKANQPIKPVSQNIIIKGKVIDENAKALEGVNVQLSGSKAAVTTALDGSFSMAVPHVDAELLFSYMGYKTKTLKSNAAKSMLVELEWSNEAIDAVVVTGLYARPKENFTGVATTVSGDQLRNVNAMNALEALKLFDPAVRIPANIQFGSDPNKLPQISLRGTNNFPVQGTLETAGLPSSGADFMSAYQTNPSMPLFILDGFEVSLQKIYDLDINRIDKMTVLKDAVATSAYGSRAANGVIVIDTKQPQAGKLNINYTATLQVTAPDLTSYNLLHAKDKLELERISNLYVDQGAVQQNQLYWDKLYAMRKMAVERGVDTYWLSKPLQTGVGTKQSILAEGGDDFVRYGLNFGYSNNKGVMIGSGRENYEGGMLLSYRKHKFQVRNQLTVAANHATNSVYGDFSLYTKLNPYWSPYDEDGNIVKVMEVLRIPGYLAYDTQVVNPLYDANIGTKDYNKYLNFNNNTYLEWAFNAGFKLTGRLGVSKQEDKGDVFLPADHTRFADITDYESEEYATRGSYTSSKSSFDAFDGTLQVDYNKSFGKNLLYSTLGASAAEQRSFFERVEARGFPSNKLDEIYFGNGYLNNAKPMGHNNITRRASAFTNLNYSYDNRYLLDFSLNVDGSTQFGLNNRFAPFWATGIGWNLHQEPFMANLKGDFLTRLKLRASIGTTGSQQFPPAMAITTYSYNTSQNYLGMLGTTLMGYGNHNLKWQQTLKQNLGMDLSLFKDLIVLRLDAYLENTNNLLLDITTAPSFGVQSYKENVGKLRNTGLEANLNAFLIRDAQKSTYWSIFVNGIYNKNKIKEISNSLKGMNDLNNTGAQTAPKLRFEEGQSVNAIWAVRSAGIDPSNGQELYYDRNGELTYTWNAADKVIVGDGQPKWAGNMGTNLTYKGFQLGLYFSYQLGGQMYNQTLVDRVENADLRYSVDERLYKYRWRNPGDISPFKGLTYAGGRNVTSPTRATSRFVHKNNFINCESISVGYQLPEKLSSKIKLRNTRFSLQTNDVFRISSIDVERGMSYPFARNFTFNLFTSF